MKLTELEVCFGVLLKYARDRGVDGVEAGKQDLYWTVESPAWLEIYKRPEACVGSFTDDEAELKKLIADPSRASAVDLDRLANLLRLLSDSVVKG